MERKTKEKKKITWKAWASLVFLIVLLSGAFEHSEGFMKAFDYQNLTGSFGEIFEGISFTGKGGTGAKEGFIVALSITPGVILVMGIIEVVEEMGAFDAAEKMFTPILRPLLGIPGAAGIAFISSFTSSDVGAVMTKQLFDSGEMNDNERTIFAGYQYTASAVIGNTISTQAALLPIVVLPVGAIIGVLFLMKVLASNAIRLYLKLVSKKGSVVND